MTLNEFLTSRILEDFGYEVQGFGRIGANNWQRAKMSDKPNCPIAVYHYEDGETVGIKDHSCAQNDFIVYSIKGERQLTKTETDLLPKIDDTEYKEQFKAKWAAIENSPAHDMCPEWLANKGLSLLSGLGGAYKSSTLWGNKSERIVDGIIIPFTDLTTGEVVGAQVRVSPEGKKFAVTGSTFTNAIHEIQEGCVDKMLTKRICILTESWTTGLELAEARPNDRVVCTAGQSTLLDIYKKLDGSKDIIVLALDKNTKEDELTQTHKKTDDIITYVNANNIISVKPPNSRPEYFSCTDFNDIAQLMGKREFGKWFNQHINYYLPYPCTALSFNSKEYKILSGRDNQVYTVASSRIVDNLDKIISPLLQDPFMQNEDYIKEFSYQLNSQNKGMSYGIGIFIEGEYIILNLKGQRWLYSGADCTFRPMYEAKIKDNIYVNLTTQSRKMKRDLSNKLNFTEHLKNIESAYKELTGNENSTVIPFLGWVVQAAYAGFLKRRSHMWLTGTTGAGKSCIASTIFCDLIPDIAFLFAESTAAGVRQSSGEGEIRCPIYAMDEVAPSNAKKAARLSEMIDDAKNAATSSETITAYGTAEQKANQTIQRTASVFISTVEYFSNLQEKSRFCNFELTGKVQKTKKELFAKLEDAFSDARESFLVFLAENAHAFDEVHTGIHDELAKIEDFHRYDGHQLLSTSYVVAGIELLVADTDIEVDVKGFVDRQVEGLAMFVEESSNVVNELLLTDVRRSYGDIPFYQYLIKDPYEVDEKFNVIIDKTGENLLLSNYKITKLLCDKSVVRIPISDLKGKIIEHLGSVPKRKSFRVGKWTDKRYVIPISKEMQDRIQAFKEDSNDNA